jgi:hypothetical protein
MKWDVVDVKPIAPLALEVRFADGTSGKVRFEASHLTGVFEPLRNEEFFRKVRLDSGAVAWPGDIDLAPDAMYEEIKAKGEWLLR